MIIPDVKIRGPKRRPIAGGHGAAAAVAEPIVAITLIDQEIREPFVTLVDTTDRAVVAVIEILSPANKFPNARGRIEYLDKRRNLMTSQTHLVEMDLLRACERMDYGPRAPKSDYVVHVSRVEDRPKGRLWLWGVEDPLPAVPIPLRGDDPDHILALQPILETANERGGYDLVVDYRQPPDPPLTKEQATWAAKILRKAFGRKR